MRLIDADALREIVDFHVTSVSVCATVQQAIGQSDFKQRCLEDIDNAPTVDAVPVRHGKWMKMTGMMPPEYHGHYECSECQWHMKGLRNSWTREEELTYCPNCGAKMDGGEANDAD